MSYVCLQHQIQTIHHDEYHTNSMLFIKVRIAPPQKRKTKQQKCKRRNERQTQSISNESKSSNRKKGQSVKATPRQKKRVGKKIFFCEKKRRGDCRKRFKLRRKKSQYFFSTPMSCFNLDSSGNKILEVVHFSILKKQNAMGILKEVHE